MRILHLIDGGSPQASPTTLALLNESLGRLGDVEQRVLLLGGSPLREAAVAAGIRAAEWISLPYGQVLLGWAALRRQARAWSGPGIANSQLPISKLEMPHPGPAPAPGFDLIHCWSVGALVLAAMTWRGLPRLLTLTTPPTASDRRWLRILTREPGARCVLLPTSATLQHEVLCAGIDPAGVHVLRPGVSLGLVDAGARAELRRKWGVTDASTKAVMLLSDPPAATDAMAAVMALGLAEESLRDRPDAPRLLLVVHPDQHHRRRAQTAQRNLRRTGTLVQDPLAACPWAVLPGCDVALALDSAWPGGQPEITVSDTFSGPIPPSSCAGAGLSLLWAMAANVPIIGEASYAVSEIVEDHHSALLARPGQPKALAHRLVQLLGDAQLAYKLRDTARHEAYSLFSRQRYCESLLGIYRQVLEGRPVEVPAPPITGGMRFTGRA